MADSPLTIAVRAYPEAVQSRDKARRRKEWRCPKGMLVFDTETLVDTSQALTFGSYRIFWERRCYEEGIFYADEIPDSSRRVLQDYVRDRRAEGASGKTRKLKLLSGKEFVDLIFRFAYKRRYLLVGFNLPFDLSRIAFDFTTARGQFAGGFSLELWSYIDKFGVERPDKFRPRVGIKHIDSKRAIKGFTSRRNPDPVDRIPDDSENGEPELNHIVRGHFLDLRTLAFAMTDRGYSLESACSAFGVEHGKCATSHRGEITQEYIDYNRRDVLATSELAIQLLEEYAKHPITLQATRAYSPASTGKAYLRGMGILPILAHQPDFPTEYLGYALCAFFGGRTSAHIRKVVVPVEYIDFLSMYPTINSLMDNWRFVTAREIKIVAHCQEEIETLLRNITREKLFAPETWTRLCAFVQIIPDGDILPARAKYSSASNDWQVGVNHLHGEDEKHALWFSLPDVVASVILTGRVPKILDAFRMEPHGAIPNLKSIRLGGTIEIDPRKQDFFRVAIEERKRVGSRRDIPDAEKKRLDKSLKILANSSSFGIYGEMNRQESDEAQDILCHGIDSKPFTCKVAHPDVPGEYCFPPLASLITGGARLMLALVEACVSEHGGTYAMEDTDSMAIVATEQGGLIPCPGGPFRADDGSCAIQALSWRQVAAIRNRFTSLNPYDRNVVPGSILRFEDDNFENGNSKTGKRRQLYCYAISAKRYALFEKDSEGRPVLLRESVNNHCDRWSEHGLGHLLNPTDPESEDREWIAQVWQNMIWKALGFEAPRLSFENLPAVGRVSISSPAMLRPMAALNEGKKYAEKIKPFSFMLTCHIKALGHPTGTDPEHIHLIAPYQPDSRRWLKMQWTDQYSGNHYGITTDSNHGDRGIARVKTHGDVFRAYEFHPESKCADGDGYTCQKPTTGLLQRRHVHIDLIKYIGKESNSLEDVEAGLVHSEHGVYTEYPDRRRDEWEMKILPVLKKMPLECLIRESGMSRRAVLDMRGGRSRPHADNYKRLAEIVRGRGSH